MATAPNPFTGSSWEAGGGAPPSPQPPGLKPDFFGMSGPGNSFNPGGFSNPKGSKELQQNMGITNILAGQQKNALAPQFAQLMSKYGLDAGQFFEQLKNLGSPYYKQKQTEAFTQGNQQNKNAMAGAEDQMAAEGYGHTPSGANAAMIGGMEEAGAQSLAEQYLQNLFQNEQMQFAGAQGEQALAQLFNPTQLLGGTSTGMSQSTTSPSFFQNMGQTVGAIKNAVNANYNPGGG